MGWNGKIIGGIVGSFIGPFGIALGIYLGHKFDKSQALKPSEVSNRTSVRQADGDFFLITVFSMFAKLAKSDGIVTKEEVEVVDQYAREVFQFDLETRKLASKIFNEAKQNNRSFEDYARDYYQAYRSDYNALVSLVEGFLFISSMENTLHPSREKLILKAIQIFNIDLREYEGIKTRYFMNTDKYYSVLGCNKADSMEEVKRKYRKLVSEYHPDKIMAKDLPEDFIEFANERFREIQEAYEYIKKDKQRATLSGH